VKRRNTPTRKKILEMFKTSTEAISSAMIEESLSGTADRSTVYRTLQAFEEDGLIHKVVDPSGKLFYAACKKCSHEEHAHNHFHFKCEKCEKVECLDEKVKMPALKGYIIHDFYGVVNGVCSNCA